MLIVQVIDYRCQIHLVHDNDYIIEALAELGGFTPAKALADPHVGVIAWSRDANPNVGEYGPPTTLFVSGDVPDME